MTIRDGVLTIREYRDFYDIPRLMLAIDEECNRWIFECSFDDDIDDYRMYYEIYEVHPGEQDSEAISNHLARDNPSSADSVRVSALHFDDSYRHTFSVES